MIATAWERARNAAAAARAFFAVYLRRGDPRPCATDAADRCGYCNGLGDGVERRAFIEAWATEENRLTDKPEGGAS